MWQPTATIEHLHQRADIVAKVRRFFQERNVLEVQTPILSPAGVTEPNLANMTTEFIHYGSREKGQTLYLQTSPEYAMKRLLAAGSGPIFQINAAFRNGELGRHHNPEFTMLEWYRPGFDRVALMAEVQTLIEHILPGQTHHHRYSDLFLAIVDLDPNTASLEALQQTLQREGIEGISSDDRDVLLQLLMTHVIEPRLPLDETTFVYEFPASQAALARVNREGPIPYAERFEVYRGGMELANGFYELTDADEQQHRFEQDLMKRSALGLPEIPIDTDLIDALRHGLPDCSGVALGLDRLVMLALDVKDIHEVLSFGFPRNSK